MQRVAENDAHSLSTYIQNQLHQAANDVDNDHNYSLLILKNLVPEVPLKSSIKNKLPIIYLSAQIS